MNQITKEQAIEALNIIIKDIKGAPEKEWEETDSVPIEEMLLKFQEIDDAPEQGNSGTPPLMLENLNKLAQKDELIFHMPCTNNENMAVSINIDKEKPVCANGTAIQFNLSLDKNFEVNYLPDSL